MTCWLQELRWPDVKRYLDGGGDTVLLPVGATEQHGRHLPLGTDVYQAICTAECAAVRTGVLVYPPIWYGWSPHHLAYPGSVTLRPETLIDLVVDVCRSLVYHGFKKILVINGHRRANLPPLEIAGSRVRNETGAYVAIIDVAYVAGGIFEKLRESEPGGIGHGGEIETSHMLYLKEDLVDMGAAVKNVKKPGRFLTGILTPDPAVTGDRVLVPRTPDEFRRSSEPAGSSGDPLLASAEKGRSFHEAVVDAMVHFIEEVKGMQVRIRDSSPSF